MPTNNQNISISILFFGATAEEVGMREVELDIARGSTVGEALENLRQENPSLNKHKLLIALNEEYVSPDATVRNGDTLAVFTPVSGG